MKSLRRKDRDTAKGPVRKGPVTRAYGSTAVEAAPEQRDGFDDRAQGDARVRARRV